MPSAYLLVVGIRREHQSPGIRIRDGCELMWAESSAALEGQPVFSMQIQSHLSDLSECLLFTTTV